MPDDYYMKRVVLPSGKTLEIYYWNTHSEAVSSTEHEKAPDCRDETDMHICRQDDCDSHDVYPTMWHEHGSDDWLVHLRCPNCRNRRKGIFTQEAVEAFDEVLDDAADALARDSKRLTRDNMSDEIDVFVAALEKDAILPEDF